MMGRPYVMDFVFQHQKSKNENDMKVYYIAESLRAIANNSASGEERRTINRSLYDILNPSQKEERTEQEVIADISKKLAELGA